MCKTRKALVSESVSRGEDVLEEPGVMGMEEDCGSSGPAARGVEGDVSEACPIVLDEFKEEPLEVDKDGLWCAVSKRGCTCKRAFIGDRDSKWLVDVVFDLETTC